MAEVLEVWPREGAGGGGDNWITIPKKFYIYTADAGAGINRCSLNLSTIITHLFSYVVAPNLQQT